jgi:hypothetical protein
MTLPRCRGSPLRVEVTGCGEWVRMAEMRPAALSPENGRLPAAISYRMIPSEKISVRWSSGRPSTCSGDM